jgi:hypothetical protein
MGTIGAAIASVAVGLVVGFTTGYQIMTAFMRATERGADKAKRVILTILAVVVGIFTAIAIFAAKAIAAVGGVAAAISSGLGAALIVPFLLVGLALGMLWAVKDEIRILINFAIDAILDLGRIFLRAGSSLVDNLVAGIRSGAAKLWETMEWMVSGVSGFFQFSPAERGPLTDRPMELAGSNITKLLTQGMETGLPTVRAVAGQLATTVASPQGPFLPPIPAAPTAATANPAAQRPSANITLNVNVGDVNAQVSELDPAGARSFIDSIGPELMRYLTAEMRRQGMVTG